MGFEAPPPSSERQQEEIIATTASRPPWCWRQQRQQQQQVVACVDGGGTSTISASTRVSKNQSDRATSVFGTQKHHSPSLNRSASLYGSLGMGIQQQQPDRATMNPSEASNGTTTERTSFLGRIGGSRHRREESSSQQKGHPLLLNRSASVGDGLGKRQQQQQQSPAEVNRSGVVCLSSEKQQHHRGCDGRRHNRGGRPPLPHRCASVNTNLGLGGGGSDHSRGSGVSKASSRGEGASSAARAGFLGSIGRQRQQRRGSAGPLNRSASVSSCLGIGTTTTPNSSPAARSDETSSGRASILEMGKVHQRRGCRPPLLAHRSASVNRGLGGRRGGATSSKQRRDPAEAAKRSPTSEGTTTTSFLGIGKNKQQQQRRASSSSGGGCPPSLAAGPPSRAGSASSSLSSASSTGSSNGSNGGNGISEFSSTTSTAAAAGASTTAPPPAVIPTPRLINHQRLSYHETHHRASGASSLVGTCLVKAGSLAGSSKQITKTLLLPRDQQENVSQTSVLALMMATVLCPGILPMCIAFKFVYEFWYGTGRHQPRVVARTQNYQVVQQSWQWLQNSLQSKWRDFLNRPEGRRLVLVSAILLAQYCKNQYKASLVPANASATALATERRLSAMQQKRRSSLSFGRPNNNGGHHHFHGRRRMSA